MGTLARSVLAWPVLVQRGQWLEWEVVGGAGRTHGVWWATVLSVSFPQRPSCSGESWEMVMEREERKSGKKGVGVLKGRGKLRLTCLLGSSRLA